MKTLKTIKRPKSKIKNSEPKEPAEKKEKAVNLRTGNEAEIRAALVKATGYGNGLSFMPTYIHSEDHNTKTHEGYLIKTVHDVTVENPISDNWGTLEVVGRLSDVTHQQWNNIIFSFISDAKRDRERLSRISKSGNLQLDRASFIETNIVNYVEA